MSIRSDNIAIERFNAVSVSTGTAVVYSRFYPTVGGAAVIEWTGTAPGPLYNVFVRGVGLTAGTVPNAIVLGVEHSAGPFTGTLASVSVLVFQHGLHR